MTTAAKFPTVALALTDVFGELPNFPPLTLNGSINNSVTSIVVNEAIPATWPQASWITIDSEVMRVTSYNAGTKTFTVAARDASAGNAQSTTAATHASGAYLFVALTAQQWNQAIAEIIAIETQAGVGFYAGEGVGRWLWDWDGKASIEATVTGTGAVTAATGVQSYTTFATGATSGSTTGGRVNIIDGSTGNGVGKLRLLKLALDHGNIDANTNSSVYLTDESVTGSPSNTARHLGIREAGAVINFSTGDNTTEQVTDITAFVTANVPTFYDITFDGVTARCYVNGTLRATHATNVPATANAQPCARVYITNTAAAGKNLYVDKIHAVFAV